MDCTTSIAHPPGIEVSRFNPSSGILVSDRQRDLHQIATDHVPVLVMPAYSFQSLVVGDGGIVTGNEVAQDQQLELCLRRDPTRVPGRRVDSVARSSQELPRLDRVPAAARDEVLKAAE